MENLLHETRRDIQDSGHTPNDIIFIGSEKSGHECTWEEFEKLADVEYDSGFGAQLVMADLIIVFSDGQKMWRHEYDGNEWWMYSTPFVRPSETKKITYLFAGGSPGAAGWRDFSEDWVDS